MPIHDPLRVRVDVVTARRTADAIIEGRSDEALDELRRPCPDLPTVPALRRLSEARALPLD